MSISGTCPRQNSLANESGPADSLAVRGDEVYRYRSIAYRRGLRWQDSTLAAHHIDDLNPGGNIEIPTVEFRLLSADLGQSRVLFFCYDAADR